MTLVKTLDITTEAEGGGARPEIIAHGNGVYAVYLGGISLGTSRFFGVKTFDKDLTYVVSSRILVSTTAQYGGPTDIRVARDGAYVYAFYETNRPTALDRATTYLWARNTLSMAASQQSQALRRQSRWGTVLPRPAMETSYWTTRHHW